MAQPVAEVPPAQLFRAQSNSQLDVFKFEECGWQQVTLRPEDTFSPQQLMNVSPQEFALLIIFILQKQSDKRNYNAYTVLPMMYPI